MHRTLILLPALLAVPLAGCVVGSTSGKPYSESQRHTYANFDKIDLSAGVEAVVRQGPFDVKAEAKKGDSFDNLIVEVNGDTLRIGRKQSMFNWSDEQYRVTVSAPTYLALEASSGSRMEGTDLTLKNLRVEVSSGASMELGGACDELDVDISSGASFDGENLRCATAMVDASSGASADAFASRLADGQASSGASVTFHGQPQQVREDTSSGGSVRSR
jgi:Putative auto-transporter adhesin, head GIN domain